MLTNAERVKIRNRAFTDIILLNLTRPGEACSLTAKDVINAKPVSNRNKGKVLFFTCAVEEPDTDDVVRDFNYHKTYLAHGTKYIFAIPNTHKLLRTYTLYLNKMNEGAEPDPDMFLLLTKKGKNPEASSWAKNYFPDWF